MSLCARTSTDDAWRELGDYLLINVSVITNNNQKADIKGNITEMNIYEDMFGVFMSGNVTFTDAVGYMEKLPIVGNEKIVVEFKTPGIDGTKLYEFYVYAIPRCEKGGSGSTKEIRLNFCSLEMLANNLTRVSRSVKGKQDRIAKDLFNEFIGPISSKTIVTEPAMTEVKLNIPNWTPIETICFLASSAVSEETISPSYVFFENNYGFLFSTIEKLKSQQSKITYESKPGAISKLDLDSKFRRVLSLNLQNAPNVMTATAGGLIGSNTIYQDPIHKSIVEDHFSFDGAPTLGSTPSLFPQVLSGLAQSNKHVTFRTINKDLYNQGDRPMSITTVDWEGKRKAYLNQVLNSRVTFTVTGNSTIQVGDLVELKITNTDNSIDTKNSGKYIVSAVCHNFTHKGYFMSIEGVTDGFGSLSRGISNE